jgi:hypothetical protein
MARDQQIAECVPIPAPVKGWNARDPIQNMDPSYAIRLINWFPRFGDVALRNGYRNYCTGLGGAVQTGAEFSGRDGTRKSIAAANGKIWDVSTLSTPVQLATGFSSNKWQCQNFSAPAQSYLIMVNGVDTPQLYNGSTIAATTFTGATQANLNNVGIYRNRLYFTYNNDTTFYYTHNTNAISGALDSYDVGSLLWFGGFPVFAGSVTQNFGSRSDDYFIVITQMGEVLTFTGSYPAGADFYFSGRYKIPPLIGKRGVKLIGSDVIFLTQQGPIPLSSVQNAANDEAAFLRITDAIQYAFQQAASSYKSNFGWEFVDYPQGLYRLINIPYAPGSQSYQYVVNARTGAWTQFTGWNANCFWTYKDDLYFGDNNGNVCQADYGQSDNNSAITTSFKTAFNYLGNPKTKKPVKFVRPYITASSSVTLPLNIDVDFQDQFIAPTAVAPGSSQSNWDMFKWDQLAWGASDTQYLNPTTSIAGQAPGNCIAVRCDCTFSRASVALAGFAAIYEDGGIL